MLSSTKKLSLLYWSDWLSWQEKREGTIPNVTAIPQRVTTRLTPSLPPSDAHLAICLLNYRPVTSRSGHPLQFFVPIRKARREGKQINDLNGITYLCLPHPNQHLLLSTCSQPSVRGDLTYMYAHNTLLCEHIYPQLGLYPCNCVAVHTE